MHQMLLHEYENDSMSSWDDRAFVNKFTLSGDSRFSLPTLADKEKEIMQLTSSYTDIYFPELADKLRLTK